MKENTLATIALFAETIELELVEQHLKNILQQTYQNKEIIVFYNSERNDLEELITKYAFQNCKFIPTPHSLEACNSVIKCAKGSKIFYKTCNPIEWLPRHIEVHLEIYQNQKIQWVQSLVEYRDSANLNNNLNVVHWRLQPPTANEFELDEISHDISIKLNWNEIFDEKKSFHKKRLITQLGNGVLSEEISLIRWTNSNIQQKNAIASQLGQPNPLNIISKENHFPTILGNIFQHQKNQEILEKINAVNPDIIESIAIKRIAGMGDVIMTEPIRRYLKKKYKNAKITLLTGETRGSQDAARILGYDEVIPISESHLIHDTLMTVLTKEELIENSEDGIIKVEEKELYNYNNYQIKIDLDLSYESRHKPYLMSYFEQIGVKWDELNEEDKLYNFDLSHEWFRGNKGQNKKVYLHREGSGWPGKVYPDEKWNEIKATFIEKGYEITEGKYFDDYHELLKELAQHSFYMGTDSGIMHLCLGLGLKCFVVAGAALSQFTAQPYVEIGQLISVQASPQELSCIGCKHKQFFNIMENNQISFVANCSNRSGPVCMTGLVPSDVSKIFLENMS